MIDTTYYSTVVEARSFAGNHDVDVEFVEGLPVPYAKIDPHTKRRTIVLEKPHPSWDAVRSLEWRGNFYHENGHFNPKVADDYTIIAEKGLNMESILGLVFNCVVDYRQEKVDLGMYAGRDLDLSMSHASCLNRIIIKSGSHMSKLDGKDDISILTACLWLSATARQSWQRQMIGIASTLRSHFSDALDEKIDLLQSGEFPKRLDECSSSEELYQLALDILELFGRDKSEEESKSKEPKSGEGDGEGEGEAETGKGGGDEEGEGTEGKGAISWRDIVPHVHDTHDATSYEGSDIDFSDWESDGDCTFDVATDLDVRDYVNNTGDISSEPDARYMRHTSGMSTHTGLANKVRKLLQVKTQSLTIHGQKRGKLSGKNMHRVAIPALGRTRERVFKKKVNMYDLDTSMCVLVDYSGSMCGDRMEHAITSALMLNEAVGRIGVPIEILGFTDEAKSSIIHVLKTYNKPITTEQLRVNMCKAANDMIQNADGEAILYAYSRLVRQPTKRKLLLVLSDGQPCADRGRCATFTSDVVKSIEDKGKVEIYGLGIQSTAVEKFYKNNRVIYNANELEGAVISVVKNHILK